MMALYSAHDNTKRVFLYWKVKLHQKLQTTTRLFKRIFLAFDCVEHPAMNLTPLVGIAAVSSIFFR